MAEGFKSGTFSIPVDVEEFDVTGLSLSHDPRNIIVGVRQPESAADIVSAYVCGTPTRTSFRVALSAPVSASGYILDYTIFFGDIEPSPIAGDSLQVSYTDLKGEVSRFLGYDVNNLTTAQANEVDSYIQSGIRNFYYPPVMDGVDPNFEWSFLRQDGEVLLSSGVAEYPLPNGFGRICGQPIFKDTAARSSLPVIPYGDIKRMLENPKADRGRPRFVSVCASQSFGTRGQTKKLYVYPKPDASYTLIVRGDSDNGKLDAVNRIFPLGGAMYSELVTESCLAVAEQKANDEIGLHTQKFNTLLVSMIQRDRKNGAQVYGSVRNERMW